MYKRITSNCAPYRYARVWISDGVWQIKHPPRKSDAYNFLNGSAYKNAIAIGEFNIKVMPIVSDILTGYIIYKKYITSTANNFNGGNKCY